MTKRYDETHHYTYLLKFKNGMLYHGLRTCHCPIELDRYYGSSKYTPKDEIPEKIIMTEHSTREEASKEEIRYHKEHDVRNNFIYYNRANATAMGFSTGASKWTWTRKDEILKQLVPLRKRLHLVLKRKGKRCNCISCREILFISQLNEHICS